MKTYTITVTGKSEGDIEDSLDEAVKLIKSGNLFGTNSSSNMSFSFDSEGDYEDEDEN